MEEPLMAYEQLIREGKVRVIGASNFSHERLRAAIDTSAINNLPRYESFQPLYNLYDRENFEKSYAKICLDHHLGVIPYNGLASGFLSGKYRSEKDLSKSTRGIGIKKYLTEKGFKTLKALDEISNRYATSPATIALAWLIAQPAVTASIASATSLVQLHDLTQAVEIELDEDSIVILNERLPFRR